MPLLNSRTIPPEWCELRGYALLDVIRGVPSVVEFKGSKNRFVVVEGEVQLSADRQSCVLARGQYVDFTIGTDGPCRLTAISQHAEVGYLFGNWGDELGGCGVFVINEATASGNPGDPTSYPKNTNFDSHYHDCDEYWIITRGTGEVVVGGVHYDVAPGDCVATGMGVHHDFARVDSSVTGIYFETTLEKRKRPGHLWDHTHGSAEPESTRRWDK